MKVKDLIDQLQKMPPDTTVVIRDADTEWLPPITEVYEEQGYVAVTANWYHTTLGTSEKHL